MGTREEAGEGRKGWLVMTSVHTVVKMLGNPENPQAADQVIRFAFEPKNPNGSMMDRF